MSDTELSKAYEPADVEDRWSRAWLDAGVFTAEAPSQRPPFSMVLPPPNVTGSLHLGHALTATIQDILARWKRMSGFNVLWLPGTDHAGIATQMVVERELQKTEKKSRHDLGRQAFLERVWQWKERYGARISEQHKVLGASLDWSRERFTMDAGASRAVREVFVRLHEEGLIYRAEKLINWCPQCLTALSDLEVDKPEEKAKGSLWHIRYPVKGQEGRFLTVATTRPETMLGDTAVAVHPDDPRYKDLVGQKVVLPLVGRELPIIGDAELVSMEFGTGAVKVTPAHDFNDYQTGLRHNLPMLSIFDERARVNAEGGPYAGLDRYEARKRILEDLAAQGLLEKEEPHELSVGKCQRCQTVVEPRLSPQWFVRIEPLARPAIEAVEQGRTKFVPESWTNTYFAWMRDIHDWTISRQLWWGHQIPAFYCRSCTPKLENGALDLRNAEPVVAREAPARCERCGGAEFEQDPDVLDTWFSSGLWPFSTLGWPEQTPELQTFYPTSVLETGHDIIFFWVARMMMMGLHFMQDVPFRTVYLHAMVRDEKGEKMSKTKGNVIDPLDVVRGAKAQDLQPNLRNKFPQGMPAFGADALRFTLASLTQQGRDIKLNLDRVGGYKAFGNKLWNASRFALMNMGDFRYDGTHPRELRLTLADRWILAHLDRTVEQTRAALEAFQFAEAANTLYQFLWYEFCDWFIELSKPVLYGEDAAQRDVTRSVLVFSLDRILRLLHPFMPFITEEIWHKLPMAHETRFLAQAAFPEPDARLRDADAEAEMAPVATAIEGIRNLRGETNLPPSARVTAIVQSADAPTRELLQRWESYLRPLAGLAELRVGPPGPKPAQAAAFVGEKMEIFVPLAGLIDFEEEKARLRKELTRSEGELAGLQKKLDNPNYVARAPAEVVEADRQRVAELTARRAKLQDNLARISEPPAPESQGIASLEATAHGARGEAAGPGPGPAGEGGAPQGQPLPDAASVVVRTGEQAAGGGPGPGPGADRVDLAEELRTELASVPAPAGVDPQVKAALDQLREGTREGLSADDHRDLGVAYMSMGLVDDAVREFSEAERGAGAAEAAVPPAPGAETAAPATAVALERAAPAAKAPARAAPVKAAPSRSGGARPARSGPAAVKTASADRAPVAKAPAKRAVVAKARATKPGARKAGAKKAGAKKAAGTKAPAAKSPATRAAAKRPGAKTAQGKRPAAKKAAPTRAAVKKAAPRKAAVKKAASGKAPAKKSVARGGARHPASTARVRRGGGRTRR